VCVTSKQCVVSPFPAAAMFCSAALESTMSSEQAQVVCVTHTALVTMECSVLFAGAIR